MPHAQLVSHSDFFWLRGLQPARLLCPWDSPGKNTGVSCHAFLQGIFLTQGSNPSLLCLQPCRWILCHWATGEAQMRGEGLGGKRVAPNILSWEMFHRDWAWCEGLQGKRHNPLNRNITLPVIKYWHHGLMAACSNHAHHSIFCYYIISKVCPNVLKNVFEIFWSPKKRLFKKSCHIFFPGEFN